MRAVTLRLTLLACLLFAAPAHALQQTLVASDGAEDDYFGWDVAVDGDTAVVGATQNFAGPGFVYVFTRNGDVKLTKKAYKLLRRRGKLKARVEMQLSRPGTGTARTSFPVTIKAPKARKK